MRCERSWQPFLPDKCPPKCRFCRHCETLQKSHFSYLQRDVGQTMQFALYLDNVAQAAYKRRKAEQETSHENY